MFGDFLSFTKYLNEKTLFPTVKRVLNFCFVLGISSFVFEKYYFKYSLLDITDYKAQYEFIAHGLFIIPFSIFFFVWAFSNMIGQGLFSVCNSIMANLFRAKIINYSVKKNEAIKMLKTTESMLEKQIIVKPKKEWFVLIYESLKTPDAAKSHGEMVNNLELYKKKLTNDSILVLRALIAICIYYSIVSYFGWILFVLLLMFLIIIIFLLVLGYQFAELLPTVIQKAAFEIEKYIKDNYPDEYEK